MAARSLKHNIKQFVPELVCIVGKGTGAATALTPLDCPGVTSVDQTGTGLYTILLQDKYNKLMASAFTVEDATSPDDFSVVVVDEDVAGDKEIHIAVFKAGALTDLTTDDKLHITLFLRNSARTV